MHKSDAALLSLLLLSSCAVGPDYEQPKLPDIGEWLNGGSTKEITTDQLPAETKWWETFNDAALNQLIDETAAHNHDIKIALATIKEAKAERRISAAGFYPLIGAGASAEREGLSTESGSTNNSGRERQRDSYSMGIDASWEPDIFGSVARQTEAASARIEATDANYRDVMLSVFAEVARTYFDLRGTQRRIEVTRHNVELLSEVEKVAESLYENGATSHYDVALARGERESQEANIPGLEAEMTAGIYRLSVLSGKPPEHHLELLKSHEPLPMPPDVVPVGLKSDILRRRPDIKRAERELAASSADIGVSTAEMFPRFPLTGSLGADASTFSNLFTSGGFTYLIAQAISIPIFQGGAARANIESADARAEQALANYQKTVLTALEDVEASLVRYGKEWQTLHALNAAKETREEAFRIARLRYDSGDENFLVVIDAERALTSTRDAIIQSETRILTNLTQLYKALGGGWETYDSENKATESDKIETEEKPKEPSEEAPAPTKTPEPETPEPKNPMSDFPRV